MPNLERIQIGAERYIDGRRVARLTPVDQKVDIPDHITGILDAVISIVDSRDLQPGDGEIDVPVRNAKDLLDTLPQPIRLWFAQLGDGWNLFVRIKPA